MSRSHSYSIVLKLGAITQSTATVAPTYLDSLMWQKAESNVILNIIKSVNGWKSGCVSSNKKPSFVLFY